ncbi:hypothetical protein E2C01_055733 [Portunus trituberculatus]|uniref:Uncharacterized protein n=1 Tax=Portunus trituberculatus TaxID=210409 RepID=A0A5B7GXR7_PORTR|nr:hypothetical protein [Portunus trituberculatus]
MILGLSLPLLLPLTISYLQLKFFVMMFFLRMLTDLMGPLLLFSKLCFLAPYLAKLFQLSLSTSIFPSSWRFAHLKRVTVLIPRTTTIYL